MLTDRVRIVSNYKYLLSDQPEHDMDNICVTK